MKHFFIISTALFLFACKDAAEPEAAPAAAASTTSPEPKTTATAPATEADVNAPAIATLDMGNYIFRLHEIIQYHPKEMQAKMMKLDDAAKDFYILDCSIENKTDTEIDVGLTSLSAYMKLSDNSTFKSMLRGGSLLASYNTDNGKKYSQQQYDLLWSKKFPAGGKARSHLYGVETPEGVTITGIGFYEKDKARNKFTGINP